MPLYESDPAIALLLPKFMDDARKVLAQAEALARRHGHVSVAPEHLLLSLLTSSREVIGTLGESSVSRQIALVEERLKTLQDSSASETSYRPELIELIRKASVVSVNRLRHQSYIYAAALYAALLEANNLPTHAIFTDAGITADRFYDSYIPKFG